MQEIVINRCYGGFGLSVKAMYRLAELKGLTLYQVESDGYELNSYHLVTDKDKETLFFPLFSTVPPEEITDSRDWYFSDSSFERDDTDLIQVVKELGEDEASGNLASLKVVEVPDDIRWAIEEYDGIEWIAEAHKTWE
jgi:hypothetical protein